MPTMPRTPAGFAAAGSGTPAEAPAGRLDGVAGLVGQIRPAWTEETVHESGERSAVPAPVAPPSYRIR